MSEKVTLRERIITSPTAERMLDRVSPIYNESYVGLWTMEAIGREYDKLWAIVDDLPQQLFPQTVTWAIELWERRYGITSDPTKSIEERRLLLNEKCGAPAPRNPYSLERYFEPVTGRKCTVVENIGPYTFGVYLYSSDDDAPAMFTPDVNAYIRKHKHSHMSYELAVGVIENVHFGCQTGYWKYPYSGHAGNANAGELPGISTHYAHADSSIHVSRETQPYQIPYIISGTVPEQSWLGGVGDNTIHVSGETEPYEIPFQPTGTIPDYSTLAKFATGHVEVNTDTQPIQMSFPMAGGTTTGTRPGTNTSAAFANGNVEVNGKAERFTVTSPMPGETPTGRQQGIFVQRDVDIHIESETLSMEYAMSGDTNTGRRPDVSTPGAYSGTELDVNADARSFAYQHPAAGDMATGEKPQFTVTGETTDSPIDAAGESTSYAVSYSMCGTMNCNT